MPYCIHIKLELPPGGATSQAYLFLECMRRAVDWLLERGLIDLAVI
jgi:hypothetical protein